MTRQLLAPILAAVLGLLTGAAQAVTCQNNIPASNPDSIYTVDANNQTVTDARTGLMWKQCLEGQTWNGSACTGSGTNMNWAAALSTAEAATDAGHTDWRLPNLKELRSLVEECRTSPSINDTVFPGTSSFYVWSGSPFANDSSGAWVVHFGYGGSSGYPRNGDSHVRLVRAGQSWAPLPALSAVAASGTPTSTSAAFVGTSDKTGTGYWLVVPSGSQAPTPAQVKAGVNYGSVTPVAHGSGAMTAGTPASFTANGLSAETGYDFYLVAEAAGQLSAPPTKVQFTTAAAIHGACGSASGTPSATAPAANLCSSGAATTITGIGGQWQWDCNGSNGGTNTATNACTAAYASQTLTISASPNSIWVDASSTVTASSTSGLPVTLGVSGPCTIDGSTVTGTSAGFCTVTASQAGTGDAGTNRYLPTANAATTINVNAIPTYPITAAASPTAGGSVTCSPASVEHGGRSICTATANAGYTFGSFGGACIGSTSPCTLANVTSAKSVTGLFTQNTYAITATASPTAGGSVTCTPNPVPHGDSASCNATPNTGSSFSSYSFSSFDGDCSGNTCDLNTVTEAKNVTALFTQIVDITLPEGPQTGQPLGLRLEPGQGWQLDSASTQTLASLGATLPPGWQAPHGVVRLQLSLGAAGSSATVVLSYPQNLPPGTRYYKYGPTTDNATPHWYAFDAAVISGNTITLTLTDGADGDDDLTENSTITDPGGPAVLMGTPVAVPTLGEWAMLLMAGLLGVLGAGVLRRRAVV